MQSEFLIELGLPLFDETTGGDNQATLNIAAKCELAHK